MFDDMKRPILLCFWLLAFLAVEAQDYVTLRFTAALMVAAGAVSVYVLELMARHTEKKQAERLQNPKPKTHGKKTK